MIRQNVYVRSSVVNYGNTITFVWKTMRMQKGNSFGNRERQFLREREYVFKEKTNKGFHEWNKVRDFFQRTLIRDPVSCKLYQRINAWIYDI